MPNFSLASISRHRVFHVLLAVIIAASYLPVSAQPQPWSRRAANAAIALWPDGSSKQLENASLQSGGAALLLNGVGSAWYHTADGTYYRYEKRKVDTFLATVGNVNLESGMAMARPILLIGRVTQDASYFKAAALLDQNLSSRAQAYAQTDPAAIYESAPFYAEYAQVLHMPGDFARITKLFSEDARGKEAFVVGPDMPRAASARAMGWYVAALVDTLPYYPHGDPDRGLLLRILNRTATRVVGAQDRSSGLWHELLEKADGADDAVATCLFTYALQKAVRLGYLRERYSKPAMQAWLGVLKHSVKANGVASITFTSSTNGGVRTLSNIDSNRSEAGAFLLASTEMEDAPQAALAHGQVVMLDSWFNSQQRTDGAGRKGYFHYKWDDYSDSGYSLFGSIFADFGADLATLPAAPTLENLRSAQYYVIVSPDIPAKNPTPHYVQAKDADQVAEWVRRGGVLILMENDPANADIEHLNLIADRFGIHFNSILSHHVIDDDVAAGQITFEGGGSIFRYPHLLYMKDTCTLSLKAPAIPLLKNKGGAVMAMAKLGKGTVVAVVDPWLYNEYTDGRKKPPMQDNYAGGREFVRWLIGQRQRNISASARQ